MDDYLEFLLGVMKYTPDVARQMTLADAKLAIDGHLASIGQKKKKLMSRNEFLDLIGGKIGDNR